MGSASKRTSRPSRLGSPAALMAVKIAAPDRAHTGEHPEPGPESFAQAAQNALRRGRRELMQHTGTAELLEREPELEHLGALAERAAGGRGALALLEGPAGIGKTRLLDAARERARSEGMAVLSARASELDREFPFGIARQLLEPLLAAADPARRDRLLHGAAAPAARLLSGEVAAGESEGGDPAWAHFHALYWLVA